MIKLANYECKYFCASGALGFDGRGYWWEWPFVTPDSVAVITKTLTFFPRKGNYRWWKFWKTFKITRNYTINALGLPNPGYDYWIKRIYPGIRHKNIIPSICPFTVDEAKAMVLALNPLSIRAIEVNISCPNTVEKFDPIEIIQAVLVYSKHPVIVKIGISHNYLRLCEVFRNRIIIDAINTVRWGVVKKVQSPLHPFEGGISSAETAKTARYVLTDIKKRYPGIQVISGNGIFDYEEAKLRFDLGANGISFGTVFVLTPWRPEKIIRRLENEKIYCNV